MKRLIWTLILALAWSTAYAEQAVMFNYQGRVKANGEAFNGNGQFKFAILDTSGHSVLWTNDGTTTGEPSASIGVAVTDGVFSVMIGDPATGMDTINSVVFQSRTPLKLRTWFSDGVLPFEQLNPDTNLVNIVLITLNSGDTDFTIYVNGDTGNDSNNGLTPQRAKKTIQAAVDVVPSRLNCNLTIDVADGVYREEVILFGINVKPGKTLMIVGDETWTPSSPTDPKVRITGADSEASAPTRKHAVNAVGCLPLKLKGLHFDNVTSYTCWLLDGKYEVEGCKATRAQWGIDCWRSQMECTNCVASECSATGFGYGNLSHGTMRSCIAKNNGIGGACALGGSQISFDGPSEFSNNQIGLYFGYISMGYFNPYTYNGVISGNTGDAIQVYNQSHVTNAVSRNTMTGNGRNSILTETGGAYYY